MQSFEVEVKSLLGSEQRTDELRRSLEKVDPSCRLESKNSQLNHYFQGGTLHKLAPVVAPHISGVGEIKLDDFAERAKDFSVRTREKDGNVYLVVKASVGEDSSENGVARMEIEERVDTSLDELDKLVLSAGFSYQAKWSRQREEYLCKGVNVTLDKNAGYGWLAEFERIVDDPSKVDAARAEVKALMQELGAEELPQSRLERMFSFYNSHWQEYYGTEKIFTVE
jgi:predicted adenylyl cyclase CyaB